MSKAVNEMRDPVHDFVYFDEFEAQVIDSKPFQRLRHVHQLALSSLVYPGASHKRFEHCVGVMEIVGRIYDTVTRSDKLIDEVRDVVPKTPLEHEVSRSLLRIAALCHDLGHLPFSHAAEDDLLPEGFDHERMTYEILCSSEMAGIWQNLLHKPDPEVLAKIALGPRKVSKLGLDLPDFTPWEAILSEMLVEDSFGADRIDYLLRDSLHTGATYGRFDHHRLIQTLRILPAATEEPGEENDKAKRQPELGVEQGGLEAAEGLWIARYFMFGQVYYHSARLIYDLHLKDFLTAWLKGGRFKTDVKSHLRLTDAEITAAMREAAVKETKPGHDAARRILERDHFRVAYQRRNEDESFYVGAIYEAVKEEFGPELVRHGQSPKRGEAAFPVLDREGRSVPAVSLSPVLEKLPVSRNEYIFASKEIKQDVEEWIVEQRESVIAKAVAEQEEGEDLPAGDQEKTEVSDGNE